MAQELSWLFHVHEAASSKPPFAALRALVLLLLTAIGPTVPGAAQAPGGPTGFHDPEMEAWYHGANWQTWWRLNRDRFTALRQRVHFPRPQHSSTGFHDLLEEGLEPPSMAPPAAMVADSIVPALRVSVRSALLDTTHEHLHGAALIALGQCDRSTSRDESIALMLKSLESDSQRVRESAALALGITGDPSVAHELLGLVASTVGPGRRTEAGRSLRTRCFATYALGFLASDSDEALRRRVVIALAPLLVEPERPPFDLPIAASHAIRLAVQDQRSDGPRAIATEALHRRWRDGLESRDESPAHDILSAHRTNSLALVLGPETQDHADALTHIRLDVREQMLHEIERPGASTKSPHHLRATVQALGLMARPIHGANDLRAAEESTDASRQHDARTAITLRGSQSTLDDLQARGLSSLAMAQQGGAWNEEGLRRAMEREPLAVPKSWQALALGVIHRQAIDAGKPLDRHLATELLLSSLGKRSEPGAAAAIALALVDATESMTRLERTLEAVSSSDEYAAHLSVALGMLGDWNAAELLDDLLRKSHRRLERRLGAAHGLALIGDQTVPEQLFSVSPHLEHPTREDASGALRCLHDIGCVFVVDRLLDWLRDEERPIQFRAQTAATLGGIAEPGEQRWHDQLRRNLTSSGAVPTLHYGVLDHW